MPPVADLSRLENVADQITEQLAAKGRVHVVGPAGAGRGYLLERLSERVRRPVIVQLPDLGELDAVIHGLLQATAGLDPTHRATATNASMPFRERVRSIAAALRDVGATLLVKLPASWCGPLFSSSTRIEEIQKENARELLDGWLRAEGLPFVGLGPAMVGSPDSSLSGLDEFSLETLLADPECLEDSTIWGEYADAALKVRQVLGSEPLDLTPVQLRCMVGFSGLGANVGALLAALRSSRKSTPVADLRFFGQEWQAILKRPEHRLLREGVLRAMNARFPVPRAVAVAVSGITSPHTPLITACLGYGDDTTKFSERLRSELLPRVNTSGKPGHVPLADYHQAHDGVLAVREAAGEAVFHWLEKAHHLAHGGAATRDRWEELELPGREFLWARARALSIVEKDYAGAAVTYQRCLDRFGDDDYSWHYLGFNLDRAGSRRKQAEQAFRKAVELNRRNAWWNSRLVTFLIDQSRFRDAQAAWLAAVERVDPEGEVIARNDWLARHMHRWVAQEWLEAGEAERAWEVLESIPAAFIESSQPLGRLRHQILDALEATQLGESVYPQGTPLDERWHRYRYLEAYNDKKERLRSWFPGRVVRAEKEGVDLVLAVPADEANSRRVILRRFTSEEWITAAGTEPETASGFVELGIYADDSVVVRSVPTPARVEAEDRSEDELRHLRSWS